jgi:hypothetical protein
VLAQREPHGGHGGYPLTPLAGALLHRPCHSTTTKHRPLNLRKEAHAHEAGPSPSPFRSSAKLTPAEVCAIRASTDSQRALSRRYGVSQPAINHIKRGRNYAWLDCPKEAA